MNLLRMPSKPHKTSQDYKADVIQRSKWHIRFSAKGLRTQKKVTLTAMLIEALWTLLFAHITPFSLNAISVVYRQERTASIYFIVFCAYNHKTERKVLQHQAK